MLAGVIRPHSHNKDLIRKSPFLTGFVPLSRNKDFLKHRKYATINILVYFCLLTLQAEYYR